MPYGLYKYIGTDWIQYFSKTKYNINTGNSIGVPERQTKKRKMIWICFKDYFNVAVKYDHLCPKSVFNFDNEKTFHIYFYILSELVRRLKSPFSPAGWGLYQGLMVYS